MKYLKKCVQSYLNFANPIYDVILIVPSMIFISITNVNLYSGVVYINCLP